jgi:hypothetical protein
VGRAIHYRYSLDAYPCLRRCIGDAALATLHQRSCIDDAALATLHRRGCIGDAESVRLHRRRCIGEAASATLHTCDAMLAFSYAGWAWPMSNECYICDAHLTLHWRHCVTALKKKILWKQNFFAISNIVQNSESKQLGKLFFSDMPIGISCVCLVLQSACEHHTWAGFTILEFFFKEILSKDISSKGIRNLSSKEISSIEIS